MWIDQRIDQKVNVGKKITKADKGEGGIIQMLTSRGGRISQKLIIVGGGLRTPGLADVNCSSRISAEW